MSGASDRRLDKIATQLTPQQAFLLWIEEAHQYPSLAAFCHTFRDAPDGNYPMFKLPNQVEQAVRGAMKGQKEDAINRAVRKAVREVAFLFYLHSQLNSRLWGDWRALCLLLAYVACELKFLCQQADPSDKDFLRVRPRVIDAMLEFQQWQGAADKIARRYYAGASPIFPGYAQMLRDSLATAEQVVTMFNDQLDWVTWQRTERQPSPAKRKRAKTPSPAVEPIDLTALKEASVPMAVDLAQHLVAMAKAEAASFMGETKEALAIMRARLWPADG